MKKIKAEYMRQSSIFFNLYLIRNKLGFLYEYDAPLSMSMRSKIPARFHCVQDSLQINTLFDCNLLLLFIDFSSI